MNLDRNLLFAFALLVFFPSCAGDIKGEAGPAGSDALSSPTLTIRGGGKISWNSNTDKVSFTEDIVIYDHQAGSTITITPSASEFKLADPDDVGYVARLTTNGASETLTEIKRSSLTDVSNQDTSSTALVLFHRTSSNTLWLPWTQRELLNGDFWQFGVALSWYERIASSRKPPYRSNNSDQTQVIVDASDETPAVVTINGKIYANTDPAILDVDIAAPGGLDTGKDSKQPKKAYYIYAIPSESERTFDLVGSLNDPTEGPEDLPSWSYIGSFMTTASSNVPEMQASGGIVMVWKTSSGWQTTVTNGVEAEKSLYVPKTARNAYLRAAWDAVDAVGDALYVGSRLGSQQALRSRATNLDAEQNTPVFFWVSLIEPQTIAAYVTVTNDDSVILLPFGWQEDPMSFK